MATNTAYTVDAEYSKSVISTKILECLDQRVAAGKDMHYASEKPATPIKNYDEAKEFVFLRIFNGIVPMDFKVWQYSEHVIFWFPREMEIIYVMTNSDEPDETTISIWGSKNLVDDFLACKKPKSNEVSIRWTYSDQRGMFDSKKFYLKEANIMYDEFCPFISKGVEGFIDSYLASKAPILVLLGPPGTGKTSFIRHMLHTRNLNAQVTFDEKVMTSDSYFIDYMASREDDIMVVEDADVLLTSRKEGGNRVMAKLLNISDGIVPILSKKIIFSTNMDDITEIDPALIRPGRCFDVLHFRQLSHNEAVKVCERAGLPELEQTSKEYTLSEIFNGRINEPPKRKTIGF